MKKLQSQSGVAAVEFAIVLPLLLLIILGIIEFSIGLYNKAVLTNASREAARAGIVTKATPMTKAQIEKVAIDYAGSNLISFSSSVPTANANPIGISGQPVTVTVSYAYTGLWTLLTPLNLKAVTTMIHE